MNSSRLRPIRGHHFKLQQKPSHLASSFPVWVIESRKNLPSVAVDDSSNTIWTYRWSTLTSTLRNLNHLGFKFFSLKSLDICLIYFVKFSSSTIVTLLVQNWGLMPGNFLHFADCRLLKSIYVNTVYTAFKYLCLQSYGHRSFFPFRCWNSNTRKLYPVRFLNFSI